MKEFAFSPSFKKKLDLLRKRDIKLWRKLKKQLEFFQNDPQHPSLRIHKLKGELRNTWSLSVTMSFRLVFIEDEEYYFFDLGTHDYVYKK